MTRRGWLLFSLMSVIWGIPYLLIKVAVRHITPATLVFARTGIGALILLPLAIGRGELRPLIPHWRPLVAYTVVELAVPWVLLSSAERRLSSSLSGLLVAAVPLVGTVVSRATGDGEPVGITGMAGLLIGLVGVTALVGLDVSGADLGWVAAMAVVVVGYAIGPLILARRLGRLPGLGVVAASLGLCSLVYLPLAVLQWPSSVPPGRVVAAVIALGVVCTALAFILFFQLIGEVGPVRATIITYVNPAVAVALGVVFLSERFSLGTGIGFVLVLLGSFLATRRHRVGESPAPV